MKGFYYMKSPRGAVCEEYNRYPPYGACWAWFFNKIIQVGSGEKTFIKPLSVLTTAVCSLTINVWKDP
jgi:hypothetical protein